LQWGCPIVTTLSLNKLTQTNSKEKNETHPAQWAGLKAFNKSGGGWVKIKAHGLRSMGRLFLHDACTKENPTNPKEVDGERVI